MSLTRICKHRAIALGFSAWARAVRVKALLVRLGRPRLQGLEHVTIPVTDLERARDFYCNVLGGAYFMLVDDATFARFGRPPAAHAGEGAHHVSVYFGGVTRLDLFLQHAGQPSAAHGHPHYAFATRPGQLLVWRRRLEARGVPVDGPIQLGPPGQASLYFNDPFGNHLEIVCLGFAGAVAIRPPETARLTWQPRA